MDYPMGPFFLCTHSDLQIVYSKMTEQTVDFAWGVESPLFEDAVNNAS